MAGARPGSGPRGDFLDFAVDDERERLVEAFTKAVAEHGYASLDVEHVVRYAGVPEATFYDHFAGKEQCLMDAYDVFAGHLLDDVIGVCRVRRAWPDQVKAAVGAALDFLLEALSLSRVFAVEAAAAGPVAAERQLALVDRLAALLREGRSRYPRAASLPPSTERALMGGITMIVIGHLLAEELGDALPDLQSELVELLLAPYVGVFEAQRVAAA